MRVALAQVNVSMGALEPNLARIERFLDEAERKGADLTLFPELALIGYPPNDLLEQEGFVARSCEGLQRLAHRRRSQRFMIGFAEEGTGGKGKGLYNAAAFVDRGKVEFVQRKRLLPTYDVFDEARYFDKGEESPVLTIDGVRFGVTICEDIWNFSEILGRDLYTEQPLADLKAAGVDWVINLSASPYHEGKQELRKRLMERSTAQYGLPLLYCNLVGGNDELLFDGGSLAIDGTGRTIARAPVFREDLLLVDLKQKEGTVADWPGSDEAWLAGALAMGIRDYVTKCGFSSVVIGLSGGIDSSLVALLAVEALGADRVTGISMPSRFTSDASREDAKKMSDRLGIRLLTVPIEPMVEAFETGLATTFGGRPRDVTEENLQARVRGMILMALSNKFGHLVLSTGNKSELAVGYCTQYGDMVGGLASISDLPKEGVYRLARHLNAAHGAIPERVFERPPTAELRPNQKDEDSLPPYSVLDPILRFYVEERLSEESIVGKGLPAETVRRVIALVDRNEFKRRQAPPALRLSAKAFGVGRRMPMARGPA